MEISVCFGFLFLELRLDPGYGVALRIYCDEHHVAVQLLLCIYCQASGRLGFGSHLLHFCFLFG
jgi:hypothetical protein